MHLYLESKEFAQPVPYQGITVCTRWWACISPFCTSSLDLTFRHQITDLTQTHVYVSFAVLFFFWVEALERIFLNPKVQRLFDVTDVRIKVGGHDWCWAFSNVLWLRLALQLPWRKNRCWLVTYVIYGYVCACGCVLVWATANPFMQDNSTSKFTM